MMHRILRQGLLVIVLLLLFYEPSYSAQNIKITIPSTIYSPESSFTLGQVAEISGGSLRTRKILNELNLFTDGRVLTRDEVLRAISDSDASDARIELYMPSASRIEFPDYEGNFTDTASRNNTRSASSLAPLIKSLASWNGDVEVSSSSTVPEGRLIDPASIIPGTQAVMLRFRDNNGRIKSLNVRLTWYQNVMTATHNIKKGDRLSPSDMVTRRMNITRSGVYASSPEEIAGFTANRSIKHGEPIMLSHLTSSSVIKRGRQVKILARYGALRVTADGVLLEDGRPGEWVKVRRTDDRRITLRAKIINENLVEVNVE